MIKTYPDRAPAFTRVELIIIVALLVLLTTLLLHSQADPATAAGRTHRVICMANLRQIGVALNGWATEHNNKFPMECGADQGGSADAIASDQPWVHFKVLSNQFATTRTLICPADRREPAESFSNLMLTNVSYFAGLDARTYLIEMLLVGDRNITNGAPLNSIIELTDASQTGWSEIIHNQSGNVAFPDGSARHLTTLGLRRQVAAANDSTKRRTTRLHVPIGPKAP